MTGEHVLTWDVTDKLPIEPTVSRGPTKEQYRKAAACMRDAYTKRLALAIPFDDDVIAVMRDVVRRGG